MKILLVSGPGISLKEPFNSGIEAFMVSFANQLVDEGHVVDVIAGEIDADAKFSLVHPFTGFVTDKPGFLKRLKQTRQFMKLDVNAYDVIHYNMFYPHLLEAGSRFHKTSFLTLHSPADKKRIAAYKKLCRQNDITFIAISDRVKRFWDRALGMDLPLINNGINMDLWPANNFKSR
ncbi:MAG: glycosyltransferase, partial [Mucilaginibacter polytrichastri]|nr:glycosyltransferase [Mucilaginibacter polytrichastri]